MDKVFNGPIDPDSMGETEGAEGVEDESDC